MREYRILKGPVNTEKTDIQKEKSNQVTFEVESGANRVEIKKAVEKVFNVQVKSVRTINVEGKIKRRGRIIGKRQDWKKAIITLMPGHRINFFEGV
jgi:large subunit ribosomal protein L23